MLTRSRKKARNNQVEKIHSSLSFQTDLGTQELFNEQQYIKTGQGEITNLVQNVLILEEITSYLSLTDLKQFRLVSRQWNQESLLIIRKHCCTIHFFTGSDRIIKMFVSRLQTVEKWDRSTAEEYVSNLYQEDLLKNAENYGKDLLQRIQKSSAGFPCSKFGLTTELKRVDKKFFYSLLETVSSFATKLELYVDPQKYLFIDMSALQFPYLRALKLVQPGFNDVDNEEMLKCFQHMVYNAPLLDKLILQINNDNGQRPGEFPRTLSSSPISRQLRTLHFRTEVRDEHLLALREMGLRLKTFGMEFPSFFSASPESVSSFLESQSANLEEFRLQNWDYPVDELPLRLPCMQKLTVLNFSAYLAKLPELSFSRDLPAIKSLDFGNDYMSMFNFPELLNDTQQPLHTLETLKIPVAVDNTILNQVARIFPNLKRLECHGPREETQSAGNGLNNLEELTLRVQLDGIYSRRNNINSFNKFVTGNSTSELKEIIKRWRAGRKPRCNRNNKPNEILQKVKILRIHDGKFYDVVCLLGPMKLRILQCLDLRNSTDSKVSQRLLEQMREKFTVLIDEECIITPEQDDK